MTTLIESASEAHIVRYNTGHVVVAERLSSDSWCIRVFEKHIAGKCVLPTDGSTLTYVLVDPQEAANAAMVALGLK